MAMKYLTKGKNYSEREVKYIRYGLETVVILVTKTTVILLLSLLLGIFKETILLIIFYGLIRGFAFGIHASSNIYCWVTSILVYTIIPLLIKNWIPSNIIMITMAVISTIVLISFAPADTSKRPLKDRRKRIKNKIITSIIAVSYTLIITTMDFSINSILMWALMIQAFCTNPLSYKLFNQTYNNYKKYEIRKEAK